MKLSHVTNKILLSDIKKLVQSERSSTRNILYHLYEIDQRKLFSDLKCTSLFDYCVRELGYSETAAQRRIVASRLIHSIPDLGEKIEDGRLTLSNIAQVNSSLKDKSRIEDVLSQVEGLSKKDCKEKIFEITGEEQIPPEKKKRISKDTIQVAIVLSDETVELMEKAKNIIDAEMTADDLIKFAMEAAIEKIERAKFKQTERPHSPPPAAVGRYVQAHVKKKIYQRDQKCVNCGSIHHLNFDHRKAFALGGKSGIENIRLLCSNCNQRARIKAGLPGRVSS